MKIFGMLKRVLLFNGPVHKEIGGDGKANLEAAAVVYASWLISSAPAILEIPNYIVFILFAGFVFWLVSARMVGGKGGYLAYARCVGYCHAPMALGLIPGLGSLIGLIWAITCIIIATRETQGISTFRSCLAVLIPVMVLLALMLMLAVMVGLNAQFLENETLNQSLSGLPGY
jgi:hypothetical protein